METEKIKTVEEQIFDLKFKGEEFNPNDFNDWAKENELEAYNLCLKVAKRLVKQPPVSVMPSDKLVKVLLDSNLYLMKDDGERSNPEQITREDAEYIVDEYKIALSKEAPKEQDKENEFTAFDQIRSETPKGIDDMVDKAMKEADERETAIEFNTWLEDNGWLRRMSPEPDGTYLYDDHSLSSEEFTYDNPKTGPELFDLFKQRNK